MLKLRIMGILKKLEQEFDFEIVDEFLDHYEIMSDALEPSIQKLSKEETYEDGVEELFRIAHNLKSASGYLNLKVLNKFASFFEDYLEKLRKTEIKVTDDMIDWLFLISDQLSGWHEDLIKDKNEFRKLNMKVFNIPAGLEAL
jgi:two-component system chemotaxis sensor kinase CheA